MNKQITVTITFTKEELATLCSCLFDSKSYWFDHLCRARTQSDYFLSENGAQLVYDERGKTYDRISTMYSETYGEED